jgi:hypothetical protein
MRDERGRGDETARDYAPTTPAETSDRSSTYETAAPRTRSTQDLDEDTARKTREIRSEIARTREDMSETIDAIQEKLTPGNVAAEAADRVKSAASERVSNMANAVGRRAQSAMETTRRTAGNMAEGAKDNAIPAMLIGTGAAWLIANRMRKGEPRRPRDEWRPSAASYRDSGLRSSREYSVYASEASDDYESTPDRYRAASTFDRDRGWDGQRARRGPNRFQHLLQRNPLMVGAAALAVGAAVGLLIPETERENEWLGEASDNLVDRAQDAVRSAATQVRDAAGDLAGQVANQVVSGKSSSE